MSLRLSVLLNNSRQDKVLARQGFNPSKPGERESFASPIYRTLDRAFEILDAERLELTGMFSVNEWRLFLDVFQDCTDIKKMDGVLANALMFQNKAREYGVKVTATAEFNVEVKPLADKLSYSRHWAILDVVERFHAAGDIDASAEGLKKLGVLCREETNARS